MLRNTRFSIARLMGVVLVMALGSAALRFSSEAWGGAMLLLTCGMLMLAAVGAICRAPEERARWLGFVLFGGGYLALANWMSHTVPTITLVESLCSWLGLTPGPTPRTGQVQGWEGLPPSHRVLHSLWALALALLGCLLAGVFVAAPVDRPPIPPEETNAAQRPSRPRRNRPAVIGLSAFWLVTLAAVAGRWPAPGVWAGLSFLLTCSLLCLAALAAAFARGRERGSWLGAALFGFGYVALTFGKSQLLIVAPHLPTESLINSLLRPGGPPIYSEFPDFTTARFFRVRNEMIKRKLDQPIPMHFRQETPLNEVLKYIRESTRDAKFPGIPIYVDPLGLQTAGRSMNSTVTIELDAIPVKDALRLCLKQLGLGFNVRSGFLLISNEDTATIPAYEDPEQVVGHSFLALIAAAFGGLAARFVTDWSRRVRGENRAGA
jgi:hypothetical protein